MTPLIQIPNLISLFRICMVPVIWVLAVAGESRAVGIGLLLGGFSDALDGYLARKLNQTSAFGSQLDSVADTLMIRSAIFWIAILRWSVFKNHPYFMTAWIVLDNAALIFGMLKFHRIGNMHLYSSKVAGVAGYLFAVHAFLTDGYSDVLFYPAAVLSIIGCLEMLTIMATHDRVDEHMGSLLRR